MVSIQAIYENGKLHLLEPVDLSEGEQVKITIVRQGDSLSTRDLLKLPSDERNHLLAEAAEQALPLYDNDPDLIDFEAFGEDDLYVGSD